MFNRFTEFNGSGARYDSTIPGTIGLNMATVTWTERWRDWATNVTLGAGPTTDQPTRYFQNDFIHNFVLHEPHVPVGATREGTDFSVGASLTHWSLFGIDAGFLGLGVSTGSLYHEAFAQLGFRRLPVPGVPYVRVSALGRYGQLAGGATFDQVEGQSYLGQASVGVGDYARKPVPDWELEFGVTIDSGLFVTPQGNSIEEIFATVALRFPYGALHFWNDAIAGKDNGPTYGATLMVDLLRLIART